MQLGTRIPRGIFQYAENTIAVVSLGLIGLFPAIEVIARKFFRTGLHGSTEYVQHLVVWITFVGGMITAREGRHLHLSAGIERIPQPYRRWIETWTACVAAAVSATLAWSSFEFIRYGFAPGQTVGFVPMKVVMAIMPVGFGIMALRFITHAPRGWQHKLLASAGLGIAALLAWGIPNAVSVLVWPLSVALVGSALLGAPIFVVLGGLAVVLFLNAGGIVAVIPNEAYTMLTGPVIPTIPLFTLAGFLLSESKAGERLVHAFRGCFGWLPGGLAIMAILVCAFFTTFTGASGVTILALGGLLSYILIQGKYPEGFSHGLLTASGSIGLLFPPSLPIILYGVVAHVNIKHMFIGGLIPGTLMIVVLALFGIRKMRRPAAQRQKVDVGEILTAVRKSAWEIALPVVIIILFFRGITTLVETGAIAVLYGFIVEVFIHRDIKLRDLPAVVLKCIPMLGGVLTILAVARGLSYFIVDAEIPVMLTEWTSTHVESKYLFLIALNIGLLITGCFMDIFSAIVVVVPLIVPLGEAFGIHPVHLGIIFLANLELGYLTPPVGLNLFLASFRFGKPLVAVYRDVIPFLIALLAAVLLITYIPWMTTALLGVFSL